MGPFFGVVSQERRHINYFVLGAPKWGVLGGGAKVYLEEVDVAFSVPNNLDLSRKKLGTPPPPGLETPPV